MELIEFKEKLRKKVNYCAVFFNDTEKAFLNGTYYEIFGKIPKQNCNGCAIDTYKRLLKHLEETEQSEELTLAEQYTEKYNKPLPNRYKYNEDWIKSKL